MRLLLHYFLKFFNHTQFYLQFKAGYLKPIIQISYVNILPFQAGAELEDDRFYLDLSRYSQPVVEALIGLVYTGNLRCALDQVRTQ